MVTESDVVELAARVMEQRGYQVVRHGSWLEHSESGIAIRPRLLESGPADSLIQSVSTVTVSHPRLIPNGVFEYQHALGASLTEALSDGFKQWADLDLVVLVDALSDAPKHCAALELEWPQSDGRVITRRAVLGPVSHAVAHPERAPIEGHVRLRHAFEVGEELWCVRHHLVEE